MSKPMSRFAIAALIVLVIVAGVFATVQAASPNAGIMKGRVDLTATDLYYANQQRGGGQQMPLYEMETESGHGGCESEGVNANDY